MYEFVILHTLNPHDHQINKIIYPRILDLQREK